jgi:hypothetical protein
MNLKEFAGNKLGLVEDAIITTIDRRKAPNPPASHTYKVQFNPGELTMDATVSITPVADAGKGPPPVVAPLQTETPRLILTLRLIFDEVNVADAFASGKIPTSASGIAKGVGLAAKKATVGGTDQDWTVQPIVEGFIGAIRNSFTRLICFEWGEFKFSGNLEHVNADYVMFSPAGNPLRAFVTLRLANDLDVDFKEWDSYIDMLIPEISLSNFNEKKSAVSNVLNISW